MIFVRFICLKVLARDLSKISWHVRSSSLDQMANVRSKCEVSLQKHWKESKENSIVLKNVKTHIFFKLFVPFIEKAKFFKYYEIDVDRVGPT